MQGRRLGNWIKQRQDQTLDYTEPEVVDDATPAEAWQVDPAIVRTRRRRRIAWTLAAVISALIVFGTAFLLIRKATAYQRLVRDTFTKEIAYVEYQPFPGSAFIKVDDPSLFGAIRDWFGESQPQEGMLTLARPTCELRVVFADGSKQVFMIDQTGPLRGPDDSVVAPGNTVAIEVEGFKRWTYAQPFHHSVYSRLPADRQLARNTLPSLPVPTVAAVMGTDTTMEESPYDAAIDAVRQNLERESLGQALLLLKEAKEWMPESVEAQELAAIAQSQLKFQGPRLREEIAAVINESAQPFQNRATYHQVRADLLKLAWMFPPDDAEIAQLRQRLAARRPRPDVRRFEEVLRLAGDAAEVQSIRQIVWSPDATRIAAVCGDGRVRIWDGVSGQLLRRLKVPMPAETVAFSQDGRHLFAGLIDTDMPLITWDVFTMDVVPDEARTPAAVGSASIDGITASPTETDEVVLHDGKTDQETTLVGHAGTVRTAVFSPDGDALLTFADDNAAIIWSDAPVGESAPFDGNPYRRMRRLATLAAPGIFANDGSIILLPGHEGSASGAAAAPLPVVRIDVKDKAREVRLSPDGKLLFMITEAGTAVAFDMEKRAERHRYDPPTATRAIGFAPDGRRLAYGTSDGAVHVVDLASGNETTTLTTTSAGDWETVRYSGDGRLILARGGSACSVWEAATGTNWFHTSRLASDDPAAAPAVLSPDGKRLAVARMPDSFEITSTDTFDQTVRVQRPGVRSLAFSPDGGLLAAADNQDMVTIHDATSGLFLRSIQHPVSRKDGGAAPSLRALLFSPDANTLLADPADGTVRLIDVTGGTEIRRLALPGKGGGPYPLSFSPDNKRILTGETLWGTEE